MTVRTLRVIALMACALLPAALRAQNAEPADDAFSPMAEAEKAAAEEPVWERFVHHPLGAFVTSAAVPGAGELLNGNGNGLYSLGAEVALWAGYIVLMVAHGNKEDEYRDLSGRYWDREQYDEYLAFKDSSLYPSSVLPAAGTDDFYDFISRPQAAPGWSDYEDYYFNEWRPESERFRTPRQKELAGQLDDANRLQSYMGFTGGAVFLNHAVSAIIAYRSARLRTEKGLSFRWEFRERGGEAVPHAMLVYGF